MTDMSTTYLKASKEVIAALVKADENGETVVDFNQIIPAPEILFAEDENGETTIPLHSVSSWEDWGIRNWGTKWNSDNVERRTDTTIYFDTPWDGPLPVLKKLSEMFPAEVISVNEVGQNHLYANRAYTITDGDVTQVDVPAHRTKAGLAWGERIRNRELD